MKWHTDTIQKELMWCDARLKLIFGMVKRNACKQPYIKRLCIGDVSIHLNDEETQEILDLLRSKVQQHIREINNEG